MSLKSIFITLFVSGLLVAYIFYALNPVPSEINQRDDVFWVFAKCKFVRAVSCIGESIGWDHRINITRSLQAAKWMELREPVDYTGVKAESSVFDGVPVRIYRPGNLAANGPGLIWYHGGGWTTGSAEGDEYLTVELARRLGILVVSVNYRLAPEFPFPVPFEDCLGATIFFLEHAEELNVDPTRIAIGGASSGGNLAAAVALKLRDVHHPRRLTLQVLFVPCLQAFDFNTPSYQQYVNSGFLPRYWMVDFWLWYAHGPSGHRRAHDYIENQHTSADAKISELARRVDHNLVARKYLRTSYAPNQVGYGNATMWNEIKTLFTNAYFVPLMAADLAGLPEAYIVTAQWDVLRDDGIMYARRLSDAGIAVEHRNYDEGFHAVTMRLSRFDLSKRVLNELVQYLSSHL